jgi:chorismate mutase
MPNLSLLCDPSHIGGARAYVAPLAQESVDLLYDGWMVEVHATPTEALSDAAQQLTPAEYNAMVEAIVYKNELSDDVATNIAMQQLRTQIDACDRQMLQIVWQRNDWVKKIAVLKKQANLSTLQLDRWNEIMQQMEQEAIKAGVSEDLINSIMHALHRESIKIHGM